MAAKPQFSLRWIFAATAVVALGVGEAVAFPGWMAGVFGFAATSLMAPAFVAGVVYARGYCRAFFIGALACWLLTRSTTDRFPDIGGIHNALTNPYAVGLERIGEFRFAYCIVWALSFAGGLVAVGVRWLSGSKSPSE